MPRWLDKRIARDFFLADTLRILSRRRLLGYRLSHRLSDRLRIGDPSDNRRLRSPVRRIGGLLLCLELVPLTIQNDGNIAQIRKDLLRKIAIRDSPPEIHQAFSPPVHDTSLRIVHPLRRIGKDFEHLLSRRTLRIVLHPELQALPVEPVCLNLYQSVRDFHPLTQIT